MKSNSGPITHNGIHPITKTRTVDHGQKGSSKESAPKPAQVAGAGAKTEHGGKKPPMATPALAPKQGAETKQGGSTTEESSSKSLASKFYPSVKGLRGGSA